MRRKTVAVSSNIVPSTQSQQRVEDRLKVYYCVCGEYVLILDDKLENLPKRQTDGASAIPLGQKTCKLNVNYDSAPVFLKREGGYEKQCRMRCKRCDLWVAYEPSEAGSQVTYIVDGALVEDKETF